MNKETFIRITDTNDDKLHVEVSGNGKDLIEMVASVLEQNEDLAEIIKMAMLTVIMKDGLTDEEMLNSIGNVTAQA
jgi:hypothetical protein